MKFAPAFALLLAAPLVFAAQPQAVIPAKSQLTATFKQMNVPVDGQFKTFSGSVLFNPKNVAESKAQLEINTASFDLGDAQYNAEVRKKEWFDSGAFPKATFVSTQVKPLSPGKFEASGKFSLKGKTQDLKITFTQRLDAGQAVYEGAVPISRKAFGIGGADWDGMLEDQVTVRFRLVTL